MQLQQLSRWVKVLFRPESRGRLLAVLLAGIIGTLSIGLGLATLLLDIARSQHIPLLDWLTLSSVAQPLRTLIFLGLGGLLIAWALRHLNRFLFTLIVPDANPRDNFLNLVYERMSSADKPRVVVFSNGIGLFIVLNTIKDEVSQVDVALPMGEDIRIYSELLNANNLKLKNVFVSNVPKTTLVARFKDGTEVEGFLAIKETRGKGGIKDLFAKSRDPEAVTQTRPNDDLIAAIRAADAVIFGPTSLFTGIIASLLAPDVSRAIAESSALKVFIAPVMTEPGKTDKFSVSDYVSTFERHAKFDLDYVILNNKRIAFDLAKKYYDYGAEQVLLDLDEFEHTYLKVDFSHHLGEVRQLNHAVLIEDDLINASVQRVLGQPEEEKLVVRHDPEKLRRVVHKIFEFIDYRRNFSPDNTRVLQDA